MTTTEYFYIKADYNGWLLNMRVFGKATTSFEYATSQMYVDKYFNLYIAGYSTAWCSTPANSMVIFKNNIDFDLWETTTNGDVF